MTTLALTDLTEAERLEIEKALAQLDPYLAMSKVDWSLPMEDLPA